MSGADLPRPHVFRPPTTGGLAPLLMLHGTRGAVTPGTVVGGEHNRFFRRLEEGVFDEDDLRERPVELAAFVAAAGGAYRSPALCTRSDSPTARTWSPRCCSPTLRCVPAQC